MKKENLSKIILAFQAIFLIFTIAFFFAIRETSCKMDEYDVVKISSPISVRIQDGTSSGLRVERSKVIVDSPSGLLVGKDARFMGDVFIGEKSGQDEIVDMGNRYLIFEKGILVEVIPKDKEE